MKIAFCGLGVMGAPMARHLAAAGHDVTVYNRTATKAVDWVAKHGGAHAPTPATAATDAHVVMLCVGNDDDVRSVVYGADGVLATMQPGAVLVDHTTASAGLARELSTRCAERGVGFVDAPVSGGQAGAENGTLTVMCGADDEAHFAVVRDVVAAYSRACIRLGGAGAGQLTKMVNQICIAGTVQGLAEGLDFAIRAGLDPDAVVEVISKGAAQSWQMENRSKTMVRGQFDFGFAVEWMRKDLGICFDEAQRNGAELAVTRIIDGYYAEVAAAGGRRHDTSSLISRLRARVDEDGRWWPAG
jgi:3-hydroxyisobutyrate dehydrogenase-like beta-hydroxyacid dehydrogenase